MSPIVWLPYATVGSRASGGVFAFDNPPLAVWLGNDTPGQNIDTSGNTRNLTIVGSVTSGTGMFAEAMDFAASGARLTSSDVVFDPRNSDWSVLGWFTAGNNPISVWDTGGNQRSWRILDSTSGNVQYSTSGSNFINQINSFGETSNAQGFVFIALKFDLSSNLLYIRVNNSTASWTASLNNSTAPFSIGGRADGNGDFGGIADQVCYLDYLASTQEENAFYNGGAGADLSATYP